MRIAITAWGTDGDVLPAVALARRLTAAGHTAVLCAAPFFRQRVEAAGVPFHPVGPPLDLDQFKDLIDRASRIRDPVRFAVLLSREGILAGAHRWYRDFAPVAAGCDLALCPAQDIPGQEAALAAGVPLATYFLTPCFLPTAFDAPAPLPDLGRSLNRLLWWIADCRLRRHIDPLYNQLVVELGGQPRQGYSLSAMYSPELNLIPISPSLSPPPPDLPPHHRVTGVWSTDILNDPAPPPIPVLEEFLATGPPPIVVTLGSMGGHRGRELTGIVIEAIRRTGQRAVIQAGWSGMETTEGGPDVLQLRWVPHHRLLPQARLVIHHGGAGTAHTVCRAGVPSVVIAFLHDQPFIGRALARLGVAPRHLYARRLTVRSLHRRLEEALRSPEMPLRATRLAERMASEDGLGAAVWELERFAATGTRPHASAAASA
jgi:UDP:flavonoid glycosyltransferase YjiC (YdhE family)